MPVGGGVTSELLFVFPWQENRKIKSPIAAIDLIIYHQKLRKINVLPVSFKILNVKVFLLYFIKMWAF